MANATAGARAVVGGGLVRSARGSTSTTIGSSITGGGAAYEVRRILKAFVDAQWLSEFDARLAEYQALLQGDAPAEGEDHD